MMRMTEFSFSVYNCGLTMVIILLVALYELRLHVYHKIQGSIARLC